jgi:eukaryotic-like serine/threonine-protein kinase
MADLHPNLQHALIDRYRIERELGRGGMATVFLARDLHHDRPVALKVLREELAGAGAERFLREIRVAARLQHPHILPIHDSGDAAGSLWYTMPFVEGESLRDRLHRERQLPVDESLRITREVAGALEYAHRPGIVHRDVKPENILLSQGHALVADFGVARALQPTGDQRLTETGMSVGTPAYMSPEQSMADPALDARSDLYSLGCVLYEMLVGEAPYTGPSAQAVIAKRMLDPVPSARRLRESVPEYVDLALHRVLAKAPADRYPSAAAFAAALEGRTDQLTPAPSLQPTEGMVAPGSGTAGLVSRRWRMAGLAAVILICLGAAVALTLRTRSGAGEPRSSVVAVLPFQNRGSSTDDYFAEGLAEEVRGKLTLIPGIEVIASSSSSSYVPGAKPLQTVAHELGARYLLTGTVRWDKGSAGVSRIRVSPELVELTAGKPVTRWQEGFEASLQDVFQVQAEIATKVASAMGRTIGETVGARLADVPTRSLPAYDLYLRGMSLAMSGRAALGDAERAAQYLEQAIALDSSFAPAWAGLSRVASYLYVSKPSDSMAWKAETGAERALALTPADPAAHLAMGGYLRNVKKDSRAALSHFVEGQRLGPNDADIVRARGIVEVSLGMTKVGLEHLEEAARLDPRSVRVWSALSASLLHQRQFDRALDACARALALDSTNVTNLQLRALIHAGQGDLEAARRSLREVPASVDQADLVALVAGWGGYTWLLNEDQQATLVRLLPTAFNNDRGLWALTLSAHYWFEGDSARAKAYADTAERELAPKIETRPIDRMLHGLALARIGRYAEARREADVVRQLTPLAADPVGNSMAYRGAAWIYATIGARDEALTVLDSLIRLPGAMSSGMLRVDPAWTPLHGDPRYERLAQAQ